MIVIDLGKRLPPQYVASPHVHLAAGFEVDVATTNDDPSDSTGTQRPDGGVATAVWAPPAPTLSIATEIGEQDQYEVRVFEAERRRLVAAIEIVNPANKDRAEHRNAFAAKCAALVQQDVAVSIIDLVSTRRANLFSALLATFGEADPTFLSDPPAMYAATCRRRYAGQSWRLESWAYPLSIGAPLPTLPLWLNNEIAVPLELDATYEETCRVLRIR